VHLNCEHTSKRRLKCTSWAFQIIESADEKSQQLAAYHSHRRIQQGQHLVFSSIFSSACPVSEAPPPCGSDGSPSCCPRCCSCSPFTPAIMPSPGCSGNPPPPGCSPLLEDHPYLEGRLLLTVPASLPHGYLQPTDSTTWAQHLVDS
jgi:hypothetical protein